MVRFRLQNRLVDPDLNEISLGARVVHLEPKVMSVLVLLVQRPYDVVSKDDILSSVWAGVYVGDAVLTNAISLIRRALGDTPAAPAFIQTIPKRGYRLITPVIPADDEMPALEGRHRGLLMRARCLRQEETVASVLQARGYAQELEAQFAGCSAASAEIALTSLLLEKLGHAARGDAEPAVRAAVDRALAHRSPCASALLAAAKVAYLYDWEWVLAERLFCSAVDTDPADADVRTEFAIMLMNQRRFEEAAIHLRVAHELDPLSPVVNAQNGHLLFYQYRMPEAIQRYERLLRLSPAHLFGRWCMAAALEHSRQPERAMQSINEGLELVGMNGIPLLVTLSRVHLLNGEQDRALEVLEELKHRTADPLLLSHVYGKVGNSKLALELLEQGADQRHYRISDVNTLPSYAPFRNDHRFMRLMHRVGVET